MQLDNDYDGAGTMPSRAGVIGGIDMNRVIYLIGLIVVVLFIAGYLGLR